jgi:hypothetical protein
MEFGIGFVLGGVSTGVAVANWSRLIKAIQLRASAIQSALQRKVAAKVAALKSKL